MKDIFKRASYIYSLMVLIAFAAIGQIIYLQYFAKEKISADKIAFRTEEIEAQRGSILSYDGKLLATSIPYYQIRIDCVFPSDTAVSNNIVKLSDSLSPFFKDKTPAQYKNEILKARREKNRYKAIGNRLVEYSELQRIRKFPLFRLRGNRGGLVIEQKNLRKYPFGKLAYRTIGYINSTGTGVGIEGSYDYFLKGVNGKQTVQRLLGGEWMPVDIDNTVLPNDGYDVRTTLDINIQEAAEKALLEQLSLSDVFEGATAIVMDVKTGAIRAIANMKKMKDSSFDESYNYAIGEATEPGSTFKLVTLVSLLEDGLVTLDSEVDAGNGHWKYSTKDFSDVTAGGYGKITVEQAFCKSSNVSFAKLAVAHYLNNEKRFVDRIQNMKVGERYNLDIKGEGRSVIYSPTDPQWSKLTLPMMAMGYGVLLTPLHTLTFYNAIANNGKMMKPYFVEGLEKGGVIEKEYGPQELSGAICSKSTIREVHKALRAVVEHGTAKAINDPRYKISGKTGTAQMAVNGRYIDANGYRRHQASFAGFFPSDNPKYSAIVVLYTNKTRANFYGGGWAAPVFKKIADRIFESSPDLDNPMDGRGKSMIYKPKLLKGDVNKTASVFKSLKMGDVPAEPDYQFVTADSTLMASGVQQDTIPDVLNMGLRDALYKLENRGYKVNFTGKGRVVSQIPDPGIYPAGKHTVTIQLSENYEDR